LLRIRLSRVGKKKQPSYRLVVADSRAPRDGAFIKIIGHYNPRTQPATLVVKEEEVVEWLRRGAQPSETAAKLLTRIGVMERAGRAAVAWDRKTPIKPKKAKEEVPAEAVAAEAPTEAKAAPEQKPETEAAAAVAAEAPAEAKAAPEQKPETETAEAAAAEAPAEAKAAPEQEPETEAAAAEAPAEAKAAPEQKPETETAEAEPPTEAKAAPEQKPETETAAAEAEGETPENPETTE
jgi:small subunit ribosomal protein S16